MDVIASSQECEEVIELTFRGQKFRVKRKYFHNDEYNLDFTTEEQDNDLMWSLFRAYWERKGFEHFYDIDGYRKEQESASENLEEAANQIINKAIPPLAQKHKDGTYVGGIRDYFNRKEFIELVKAGAQWQKEQMMKAAVDATITSIREYKEENEVDFTVMLDKGIVPYVLEEDVKLIIIKSKI